MTEWGHQTGSGKTLTGIEEQLSAQFNPLRYRISCPVHTPADVFRNGNAAHPFVEKLCMSRRTQRQDTQHDRDSRSAGGLGDLLRGGRGVNRLGNGELGSLVGFPFQPFCFLIQPLRLGTGIEDHPRAKPGCPGQLDQPEDIEISNRGGLVALPVGEPISGCSEDRVDPESVGTPEQALQTQGVVVPGGLLEYSTSRKKKL